MGPTALERHDVLDVRRAYVTARRRGCRLLLEGTLRTRALSRENGTIQQHTLGPTERVVSSVQVKGTSSRAPQVTRVTLFAGSNTALLGRGTPA